MKINVVGGGPAGLYFAILMKKSWPGTAVTVFERNRPENTFGFGVVFSDETLDNFEAHDRETYRALKGHFAYWDDIEINFRGTVHRIGGNGFCGCSRTTLLKILNRRARSLGVELKFGREITDIGALARGADLTIGADGINSRVRRTFANRFNPTTDLRPNFFSWMGSTRPFDAFTFFFRETTHGIFIAHCYQYQPGRSTWVMETDPETFRRAGLDRSDEKASARFLEEVFAEELQGHRLITNKSIWRNFPTVRCEHWTAGNVVLIGDAKATAHFSIGSGTKLAMEDAIALHQAFRATGGRDVTAALATFEAQRRDEVEKTQHSADVSLVWFEHVRRFWAMDPTRFAFGLMTRSKAITYDNLALRAPGAGVRARAQPRGGARGEGARLRRQHVCAGGAHVPAVPPARHDGRQPRRRLAHVPVLGGRRPAQRLAPGASRQSRHRRRRPRVHRDDRRVGRGAHLARLHRALQRRAGSGVAAYRRLRPRQLGSKALHAARPCRPQGRHAADVGGHGRAAGRRRVADRLGVAHSLLPAQPGAARDDARRHGARGRRLRRRDAARRARRLRHDRAALRPWLSAGKLHLAADQYAHRQLRRFARQPHALPAG